MHKLFEESGSEYEKALLQELNTLLPVFNLTVSRLTEILGSLPSLLELHGIDSVFGEVYFRVLEAAQKMSEESK